MTIVSSVETTLPLRGLTSSLPDLRSPLDTYTGEVKIVRTFGSRWGLGSKVTGLPGRSSEPTEGTVFRTRQWEWVVHVGVTRLHERILYLDWCDCGTNV